MRAAAASFGLDFVALGEASYYRAVRHRADEPSLAALDAAAARTAAHTPGYRAAGEAAARATVSSVDSLNVRCDKEDQRPTDGGE